MRAIFATTAGRRRSKISARSRAISLGIASPTATGLPGQQIPGESTSLATLTPQAKVSRPSWTEFIDKAIALSAEQNHGSAALSRLCKPELKTCVMAVAYLLKDGRQGLATVIQSAEGNITRREVCESNVSNDLRYCIDWDTGAKYRDVKNTKGDWVQALE